MVSYVFAAVSAGFAFIVSLITGLVSRVGFGHTLLRAFIAGLIFALLGAALEMLSRSIFPDLFSARTSGSTADDNEPVTEAERENTGAQVDITLDDGDENIAVLESADEDDRGFVEEIGGDTASEQEKPVNFPASNPEGDDNMDSMEELPSLDGLSDSFESSWGDDDSGGNSNSSSAQSHGEIDVLGELQNPGDVARAVQTIMKRDQEG